jgi:DNA-binding response OmpR family regulator
MLTARGRADDVVKGFEAGADDYLPQAVRAGRPDRAHQRAAATARVGPPPAGSAAAHSPADRYDFRRARDRLCRLELRRDGRTLPLTLMEANLLRYLVQREGQVVSRKDILEQVWGVHEDTDTRAIDNFVVRLRRHIEDDAATPSTC